MNVSDPVDSFLTIKIHSNLYHSRSCRLSNGIFQIKKDKNFFVWVLNMSDKLKRFTCHTPAGIIATATSGIYHQTSINVDIDRKKESVEDNPVDLKTHISLTVYALATINSNAHK